MRASKAKGQATKKKTQIIRVHNHLHEKYIGLRGAVFLQQVHYWLQRTKHKIDGRKWIYNTYEDWCSEDNFPHWNVRTVRRITKKLREMDLLKIDNRLNKMKSDWTNWYSINYEHPFLQDYPLINSRTKCPPKSKSQRDKMSPTSGTKCPSRSGLAGQNVTLQRDKMAASNHKSTTTEKHEQKNSSIIPTDEPTTDFLRTLTTPFARKEHSQKTEGRPKSQNENDEPDSKKDLPPDATAGLPATDAKLKLYYGLNIPKAIDLRFIKLSGEKNIKLSDYTKPFKGNAEDLRKKYGTDFSDEPFDGFDKQVDSFFKQIKEDCWNEDGGEPGEGFKVNIRRAAKAGVLHRVYA